MHIAIIFSHIGPYHIARLQAASTVCQERSWHLTAIQSLEQTSDHPWGKLPSTSGISFETLLDKAAPKEAMHPDSSAAVAALPSRLDGLNPDAVVIPGWGFKLSRAALRWCRQHSKPAILMSESKRDDEPRAWWKEQIKSWLYVRKYSAALVGGPAHRNYLTQLGMSSDRIFYGYDVVDNDYFTQQATIVRQNPEAARKAQPNIPRSPYFLAVTRLLPRKNMIRLVQAFIEYSKTVGIQEAWPLVICGSGEDQPAIQQLIDEDQLESLVHLPGFLTYQQIASWYALAGAFIHPALTEQWGLVINEACAAGIPILCSNTVGACQSLVKDGANGFTFHPKDTSNLVQSLLKIHSLTGDQRRSMGLASQKVVEQCSPQQFGKGFLNAIETALSAPS